MLELFYFLSLDLIIIYLNVLWKKLTPMILNF